MLRKFTKKRWIAALGVVAALAVAGVAVAYFLSAGSGTGTGTIGRPAATDISFTGTVTGDLFPAGAPGAVSVTIKNDGSGAEQIAGAVHLDSITIDTGSAVYTGAGSAQQNAWDACDLSVSGSKPAFTMADITIPAQTLARGASIAAPLTGALQMNDTQADQSGCEGAPLLLHLTDL